MQSFRKCLIPAAVGASLLLAACGSSATKSSSSSAAASNASAPTGSASGGLTIGTASGAGGTYLTGASGRALYLWVGDGNGKSNCSGGCAQAWPPLRATSMPKVTGGAKAADVTLITRADGSKQVAYKGHPLYYFSGDTQAGTTHGEGSDGFGAKWWLVSPSGGEVMSAASSSSSGGGSSPY